MDSNTSKQLPQCLVDAIVVCQMVEKGSATPNIKLKAERTLAAFFADVEMGTIQMHLSQEGHLECASTEEPGPQRVQNRLYWPL